MRCRRSNGRARLVAGRAAAGRGAAAKAVVARAGRAVAGRWQQPRSPGAQSVVAGPRHTGVLTFTGGVLGWGDTTFGQRGNGASLHQPVPVVVTLP